MCCEHTLEETNYIDFHENLSGEHPTSARDIAWQRQGF